MMAPQPTITITSLRTRGRVQHVLVTIFALRLMFPMGCSAFHQHQQLPMLASPSRSRPLLTREPTFARSATTSSTADQSINDINVDENDDVQIYMGENNNNKGFELWLDLRGTSLTPKTALELWDMEERQNNQQQPLALENRDIDLSLTRAPYVKCLVSSTAKTQVYTPQNGEENHQNIDVLLIAECNDEDDMKSISQMTSPTTSTSIGKIQSLQASSSMPILPNPLPAMEVASKGQWIIIDTDGWRKFDEEERSSMALPLIDLIYSGSLSSTSGGGIGLTCHTNNEIVKTAMFIQSMTNGGGGGNTGQTKTMESGIIIPDDDAAKSPTLGNANFAIIVPCDMGLLRTAMLLFDDL